MASSNCKAYKTTFNQNAWNSAPKSNSAVGSVEMIRVASVVVVAMAVGAALVIL